MNKQTTTWKATTHHNLADRLHARSKNVRSIVELLEIPARNLHKHASKHLSARRHAPFNESHRGSCLLHLGHNVVQRRFKARCRGARHRITDLEHRARSAHTIPTRYPSSPQPSLRPEPAWPQQRPGDSPWLSMPAHCNNDNTTMKLVRHIRAFWRTWSVTSVGWLQ